VATLDGTKGTSTGTCSITGLSAGGYWLRASYLGDDDFQPSVSAVPTPFAVTRASSTTRLKLSAAKVTYGREQAEHFSVVVSPVDSGSGADRDGRCDEVHNEVVHDQVVVGARFLLA
jgi:hypothetical protein